MYKHLFIVILTVLSGCTSKRTTITKSDAGCFKYYDKALRKEVYTAVDDIPLYPGGMAKLAEYLRINVHYPQDQQAFQGSVTASFIVDTNGELKDIRIPQKEIKDYTLLDKEMLKAVSLMPKWKVGKCNGKKVPFLVTVPIHF